MGKRGPQPISLNWDEVDKLVSYQCTQEEIAHFFCISLDTLERACLRDRGIKLADLWAQNKAMGRVKLRKIQYSIAERGGPGSAAMAIYLGKVILNQRDTPPPDNPQDPQTCPQTPGLRTFEEFCLKAGYPKPYHKQIEMMNFSLNETDPRMLLGARGTGKTDYVTVMGLAYDIYLNGIDAQNLIISKSKSRNTAIIEEIGNALKNNDVVLEKENSSCIRVQGKIGKDHSVEAITIKSSMRGRHPYRVVMDDPVTEEDISEAMRKTVKIKYNEVMKLCTNVIVIGQPAHAYDLYAELRPLVKKMEVIHGDIPELMHDLEAQRLAGVDENSIQASYFLKIVTDGTTPFSNIKYIDKFPNGDCVAFIDPSDGGDFTALSIVKGYMDGVAVQGHVFKKAWYHCIDEMIPIFKARGVKRICFETNCTGRQPIEQLIQLLSKEGIGVVGKHSDTSKHAVIMSAGSYAHLIHLSKESDRNYINHVVQYEYKAKFDDAPDSLARCLEWIGLIRGKK